MKKYDSNMIQDSLRMIRVTLWMLMVRIGVLFRTKMFHSCVLRVRLRTISMRRVRRLFSKLKFLTYTYPIIYEIVPCVEILNLGRIVWWIFLVPAVQR